MARGDLTIFNKAKEWEGDGTFDYDTNTFKMAILDNSTTPTAAMATPTLASFTEVGTAGTYSAGGFTCTMTWAEVAGVVTLDSVSVPTWNANGSNDNDAHWAVLYQSGTHNSIADACLLFVDLNGPVSMITNKLTLEFDALGAFTKT